MQCRARLTIQLDIHEERLLAPDQRENDTAATLVLAMQHPDGFTGSEQAYTNLPQLRCGGDHAGWGPG